jgi:GNAT superfamily N-acetyltransferase
MPDTLRPMPLDASWIQRALLLSDEAGWNQNAADWAVFFAHGTVLGLAIGDRLIATAAALPYGDEFGWISMVLVTAEWRRQGLAKRLVAACTAILRESGQAAILDAAPAATSIYSSLGFVPLCTMERWEGNGTGEGVASSNLALDQLVSLDRSTFGADRSFLVENFLSRPGSLGFQSSDGFAILRRGSIAFHLGPVVAEPEEGAALVAEAIRAISASDRLFIDVLDAGAGILPMLTAKSFRSVRCFTRMALGLSALPGDASRLLAAAGPEFG